MTARVVCLASAKGGSGKTMLTASLAAFVGRLGKRVLVVDTDAATNGLTLLYLSQVVATRHEAPERAGLFDVEHPVSPERSVVSVGQGVDLLPASFVGANSEDVSVSAYERRLSAALDFAREQYDLVLLDAQAGADEYARHALRPDVSDRVLIVSEYDPMSAAGVERLKALLGESVAYSRTWIVLNKMLPEFAKSFSEFLEIVRYAPPIPWDADVVRAYARRRLALDFEFGNEHTVAVMRVLRTVLHDELAADLDAWAEKQADVLRQPVEVTVGKLREELREANAAVERRGRKNIVVWMSGLLVTLPAGALMLAGVFRDNSLWYFGTSLFFLFVLFALGVEERRSRRAVGELAERRFALRQRLSEYEDVASLGLADLVRRRP
ncbi:ParA family protein [Saccharothrix longispora]|uniref:Cellulose biosynthesis protein BcsQ n=1 Tax=Saccharothrix longispora TaxID=33920 RepID=A0ABU1PMW3_9PSEU|nr:ParA family protein [Saccharothrix longispora]MDR6592006.1 cellulose biosynthesis protein BcsQ [Saccharothrix longispora]